MSMGNYERLKNNDDGLLGVVNLSQSIRLMVFAAFAVCGSVVAAGPVQAGCGLTVTFDNDLNTSITILEVDAKTTTGSWKTVHDDDFTIGPGKKVSKAIETNAGCAFPHHLRAKYQKGKSTLYKTKGPIATAVDKKINLEFDD